MTKKVAFVTGASRGIGAESAAALAAAGYRVAITARTLNDGEAHSYALGELPLPGSLHATARAIEEHGGEALCLQADILNTPSLIAAVLQTLDQWGRIDLLLNNAVYQGKGNMEPLLALTEAQALAMYRGNILTPLALVQAVLPGMLERGDGTIINMLSATAFLDPPGPPDRGGWGFIYPSTKAGLARMAGCLRAEHPDSGVRVLNIEPGTVITEAIRLAGYADEIVKNFEPTSAAAIGAVIAWLADNEPRDSWNPLDILRGPAIARELGLLDSPSLLEAAS
jgi:NAD(P)-dependent dehydrogenase (short-subunit alcohol dehydrogenase family)